MAPALGYKMSWSQLNEIWKYDNEMATKYFNFPLRRCSAVPSDGGNPPLPVEQMNALKRAIREMWMHASVQLEAFKLEKKYEDDSGELHEMGWGLRVGVGEQVSFPANRSTIMGWMASAPTPEECPTGHRYLRSPVVGNLYLGGPISLLNFSLQETVSIKALTAAAEPRCFHASLATRSRLSPLTELVWNYGLRGNIPLYEYEEWHLAECCRTGEPSSQKPGEEQLSLDKPDGKKLRLSSSAPKGSKTIELEELCTYCGRDLWKVVDEKSRKLPTKVNMKRHIALHHAEQLCIETGLDYANADPESALTPTQFLSELHKCNETIQILKSHGRQVIPACNFLKHLVHLPEESYTLLTEQDKRKIFSDFQEETKRAYRLYRAVHLRGFSRPMEFQDLLPSKKRTDFKNIAWFKSERPGTQNFSVVSLLNADEAAALASEVRTKINIILEDCESV